MKIKRGSTSVRRLIFIGDSTSTTGAGLTGLVYNSAGLTAYYFAGDLSNEVQITLATATLGSYTSGGFVEVDATNMPGWYEVGIPDAALDGGNEVAIQYRGATNMVPVNIYIELDAVDYQSATNFGLSKFADIEADTQNIQSRLPESLAFGYMPAYLYGCTSNGGDQISARIATNIVDGSYSWPSAVTVIQTGLSTFNSTTDLVSLTTTSVNAIGDAFLSHVITKGDPGSIERAFWQVTKAAASFDGTVQTSVSNTASSFLTDIAIDDFAGQVLVLVDGALAGEARAITSVVSGVVTVHDAFTGTPADGVNFLVLPQQVYSISQIQSGLATSAGVTSAFTEIKGATWDSGTDTLEAIRDASGGGGGVSALLPAIGVVPVRVDQTMLTAFVGETIDVAIVVYQSDGTTPMDLSGKTLEVCFEGTTTTDVAVVDNANITVSGDDNNIVTFAYPSAVTGSVANYHWSLRDAAAPKTVWQYGTLYVKRAALKD